MVARAEPERHRHAGRARGEAEHEEPVVVGGPHQPPIYSRRRRAYCLTGVVALEVADSHRGPRWAARPYPPQIRDHAPNARDFTNQRYRHRGIVDEVERGKNRTKSKVRAK